MRFHSLSKRILILLVIAAFIHTGIIAQAPASYIPPSPNAASLGLYGQIPVNKYSGVPDIKVPLNDVDVHDYKLPFNLSYHSGGIHQSDEASWVGLGWSLNAGGCITRAKREKDDFSSNGYQNVGVEPICKDAEPDMFYYNVAGLTGKFIVDANNTIRQLTRSNVRIQLDLGSLIFTITSTEGVKYTFSKKEFTVEYTHNDPGDDRNETYVSAWYLTTIELLNGKQITFEYDDLNTTKISRTFYAGSSNVSTGYSTFPGYVDGLCCPAIYNLLATSGSSSITYLTTDEVILKKIRFPDGYIQFNVSTRTDLKINAGTGLGKKLSNIAIYRVYNNIDYLFREYDLQYDYFNSGSGAPAETSTRLRLVSVTEKNGTLAKPPFLFEYTSNVLPDKYASTSTPGGFVPDVTQGLLQKITYPTGGSNIFEFESHQYTEMQNGTPVTISGGGARVKRIRATDPVNTLFPQRFEYTNGKLMGKFIGGQIIFNYGNSQTFYGDCCNASSTNPVSVSVSYRLTITSDFSGLGETNAGNMVGYDQVTVYEGENGENGKTVTTFENTAPNYPNYQQGIMPVPVPPNVSNKNGSPIDVYEYANRNSTWVLLKKTHNEYATQNTVNTSCYRKAYNKCFDWGYTITSEWVRQTQQVVYNYDKTGNNPVTVTTNFIYNNVENELPTNITTTDSKGNLIELKRKYSQEMAAAVGGVYTTMVSKNLIDIPIEETKYMNTVLLTTSKTNYKDWYNDGKVIKPETEEFAKSTNPSEVKTRFFNYDRSGNPLELAKENGSHVCYIWNYNSQYPIAQVTNAKWGIFNETTPQPNNFTQRLSMQTSTIQRFGYFNTNKAQNYKFQLEIQYVNKPLPPTGVVVKLYDQYGGVYFSKTYTSYGIYNETVPIVPGNGYNIGFICFSSAKPYLGGYYTVIVNSTYENDRGHSDIFHTSFESPAEMQTTEAKTGRYAASGPYTLAMPATPGNYVLSWWQKPINGLTFEHQEQIVTSTGASTPDVTIGASGLVIDDVKLYPVGAEMKTYTYDALFGMTSESDTRKGSIYYEYDELARLKRTRDKDFNIIKEIDYQYQSPATTNPLWVATGATRCKPCPVNPIYSTNIVQYEEKDQNPQSATYGTSRWIDNGNNGGCGYPAWQNVGSPVCQVSNGQNTGNLVQMVQDVNPCSSSYGAQSYTIVGYNPTACPIANQVEVTYTNYTYETITLWMLNTNTGSQYSFYLSPQVTSTTVAGTVPPGTYNISMSSSSSTLRYYYRFYNASVNGNNVWTAYGITPCATGCAFATISYY